MEIYEHTIQNDPEIQKVTGVLRDHMQMINIMGDDLSMAAREVMAKQLEDIQFQVDIDNDEQQIQEALDLL